MLKKLKSFLTRSPHLLPSNTIHVLFWAEKLIILYKQDLFKHGNKEENICEDTCNSPVLKNTTAGRKMVLLYRATHMSQYLQH